VCGKEKKSLIVDTHFCFASFFALLAPTVILLGSRAWAAQRQFLLSHLADFEQAVRGLFYVRYDLYDCMIYDFGLIPSFSLLLSSLSSLLLPRMVSIFFPFFSLHSSLARLGNGQIDWFWFGMKDTCAFASNGMYYTDWHGTARAHTTELRRWNGIDPYRLGH